MHSANCGFNAAAAGAEKLRREEHRANNCDTIVAEARKALAKFEALRSRATEAANAAADVGVELAKAEGELNDAKFAAKNAMHDARSRGLTVEPAPDLGLT